MTKNQIEEWALRVVDAVKNGHPREDARVELKAQWPKSPEEAARQIAGHANAARGGPILWLIGVHETQGVWGAEHQELATWFSQVKAQFDGVAPNLFELNIPVEDKTVVALYFETDRAPFVIKNPNAGKQSSGPIKFEVPWREGTQVRSAQRADLIRLLVPLQQIPDVEGIDGKLTATLSENGGSIVWFLYAYFYIIPMNEGRIVIQKRKSLVTVECPGLLSPIEMGNFRFYPKESAGRNSAGRNQATESEALIYEPGTWYVNSQFTTSLIGGVLGKDAVVSVRFSLAPSGSIVSANLSLPMMQHEKHEWGRWGMGDVARLRIPAEDPYGTAS